MAAEQVISMKQVCKSYQMGAEKLNVLKKIDFTVNKGEFTAILGPSGSGKSTLMNIIGCMDTMDSGSYELNSIPIHAAKEKELTKIRNQEIGFIFQNYHLIPTYTVMQNIIMPLLMRGKDRKTAEKECEEVISMLGLAERLRHKPSELSGGQRQRVAIARALCSKPSLLLADEPTGALDQNSGTEVLKLFTKLHEMGNTIVMITHDMNVAKWAQRTVRIVDGEMFEEN
ncbi:MAG: ABC transporter ATP-binding protein [Oscillospiraceae bacterium]|nr:ABC transporter ATP-binding protein [Oscillospiraceae bacterium]MCR4761323.1 ABC transporter ATP-binding protein [Oscillospiraceae bacterium]